MESGEGTREASLEHESSGGDPQRNSIISLLPSGLPHGAPGFLGTEGQLCTENPDRQVESERVPRERQGKHGTSIELRKLGKRHAR